MRLAPSAIALGLAALVGATAIAQLPPEPELLSLDRAIELALRRNPALQAEIERRTEVAQGIREARAEAFPQLDLLGGYSRSRNPAFLNNPDFEEIIGELPPGVSFEPRVQELWDLSVQMRQVLFTFGKVGAAIDVAQLVAAFTEAQIETARLDTAFATAEAYYGLLAANEALEVIEIQRQARREVLALVEARYELQEATRLELLRAEAQLADAEPAIANTRGQSQVARSRLRAVLGLQPGTRFRVEPLLERGEEALPPAPPLDVLLDHAFARRPELVDLELQSQALERQQDVVRAEGRPQFDLFGYYGRQARLFDDLTEPLFANWLVDVGFTWELFDGSARHARVAQIDSQRRQLDWLLRDLRNSVALQVERARAEYEAAIERWRAAEVSAAANVEASRVSRESYAEGVALQTEVLDAQEQETRARVLLVESFYNALIVQAELLRAIGLYPTNEWGDRAAAGAVPAGRGEGEGDARR